jgi:hypothetical protein
MRSLNYEQNKPQTPTVGCGENTDSFRLAKLKDTPFLQKKYIQLP